MDGNFQQHHCNPISIVPCSSISGISKTLKSPMKRTEEIDGAMFGKIFHDAASTLYLPYKNIPFTADAAKEIKRQINNQVTLSIQKEYDGHYNKKGYAFLIEKIIERYTEHIVELDLGLKNFLQ